MGSLQVNITGNMSGAGELDLFSAFKGVALGILVVWTVIANCLVFVVLYKNPRLQTVPNLLVGNLAFSDLCLGMITLPFSAVYAVCQQWIFGRVMCELWLSMDILCCTASIWNLSMIGLDRYWAITAPIKYMNKRTKRTALIMIASVWVLSLVISIAPFLGWKSLAQKPNHILLDNAWQCNFMELPSYTIYSATGSFFVPTFVMLFVYYRIYRAFAEHKARQMYRQKVIRKHIESTILHDISHVLPTSDEFDKEKKSDEQDEDDESGKNLENESEAEPAIPEEPEDEDEEEDEGVGGSLEQSGSRFSEQDTTSPTPDHHLLSPQSDDIAFDKQRSNSECQNHSITILGNRKKVSAPASADDRIVKHKSYDIECDDSEMPCSSQTSGSIKTALKMDGNDTKSADPNLRLKGLRVQFKKLSRTSLVSTVSTTVSSSRNSSIRTARKKGHRGLKDSMKKKSNPITYERVFRHKNRRERRAMLRKSLQEKPKSISAAKEKRGVKVLGIILGCFLVCWTPFFVMYIVCEFTQWQPNPHIEQFITWLGYSNSAMNPIIYTVFNRDYQNALKRLFLRKTGPIRL